MTRSPAGRTWRHCGRTVRPTPHRRGDGRSPRTRHYFPFDETVRLGDRVIEAGEALEYDRKVVRHVYLGEPLDVDALPAFCTDNQAGCSPFPAPPPPGPGP